MEINTVKNDSLIAKVICKGRNRTEAIENLSECNGFCGMQGNLFN